MADKVWERAIVTGASSGIGRAIASQLARRGGDLVVVARRESMLEDLARDLSTEHGVQVEVLAADLTDAKGMQAVEERIRADHAPVDLVVNNAGFGTFGAFWELPVDREEEELRLNVLALARLSHAALSALVPRGRGGLLNVSSAASFQPMPFSAVYSSSKAFVTAFTQALHEEARPQGVHVTALCPGYVHTEFQEVAEVSQSAVPKFAWLDVDHVARAGIDGVTRNHALAVPGAGYQALGVMSRLLPRSVSRRIAGTLAERRTRS
jgi:short-subunit dehydrogenase